MDARLLACVAVLDNGLGKYLETKMPKILMILFSLMAAYTLSGCAVAVGAGAAVIADEIVEDEKGGDGLF